MSDRQTVLLESLDRVVHTPRDDQIWVAAADVQVAGQVRCAVCRPRMGVWVGRRGSVHLCSHDVGGWILLSLL